MSSFDDSLRNRYWDVRLYGFESYLKMEAEEKGSAGFDKTGTLVVATDEKVEATIKTGIALAKAAGYTGEYITDNDRIKEILPDISTDNILAQATHRMTDTLTEPCLQHLRKEDAEKRRSYQDRRKGDGSSERGQ